MQPPFSRVRGERGHYIIGRQDRLTSIQHFPHEHLHGLRIGRTLEYQPAAIHIPELSVEELRVFIHLGGDQEGLEAALFHLLLPLRHRPGTVSFAPVCRQNEQQVEKGVSYAFEYRPSHTMRR